MTGPAPTTALVMLFSVGTPLLVRSVEESRREVQAVAASNRALEVQAALLRAKLDSRSALEAEAVARRAVVDRLLAQFAAPEIATEERLLERTQECCEQAGFQLHTYTTKATGRLGEPRPEFAREVSFTYSGEGSFEQLVRFLALLEQGELFVRLNRFTCTAKESREGTVHRVVLAFDISTFRFDVRTP